MGIEYVWIVSLKGYDTINGRITINQIETVVIAQMVKNDNPATAQVLITDSIFKKPIQGLIAVFKFVDTN